MFGKLAMCRLIRRYIPALVTSILCLPVSAAILYRSYFQIDIDAWYVILGLLLVALNRLPALKIAGSVLSGNRMQR